MTKYSGLQNFLAASPTSSVTLSFAQVDIILADPLPRSAREYEIWWNNDDPSHSHCRSWRTASFLAVPDLGAGLVRFERVPALAGAK